MLALVSSNGITVIGCTSRTKKVTGCDFSLSTTSKSCGSRSGTRRCCASLTVAKIDTTFAPDRKTGSSARTVATRAISETTQMTLEDIAHL